eukprot:1155068-Pelagomonas_calceolata.AAC.1
MHAEQSAIPQEAMLVRSCAAKQRNLNLSTVQAQCYLGTLATRHPDPSIVHALLRIPGYTPPTAAQHASIGCQR